MKHALNSIVVLLTCVALAGCGSLPGLPEASQAPASIKITSPAANSTLQVGAASSVQGQYTGAVASVRLSVNGAEHAVEPAANNKISIDWSPLDAGQNVIYLEALDAERKPLARSELVFVKVEAPQPTSAPLPTAAPVSQATLVPTVAVAAATNPPSPAATPALTITNEFANLRAGPDTAFELVGRLNQGQTAKVLGRSADGKWWQIEVDGKKPAWVFGSWRK
jgi:predicted small lipoprotein YifL